MTDRMTFDTPEGTAALTTADLAINTLGQAAGIPNHHAALMLIDTFIYHMNAVAPRGTVKYLEARILALKADSDTKAEFAHRQSHKAAQSLFAEMRQVAEAMGKRPS